MKYDDLQLTRKNGYVHVSINGTDVIDMLRKYENPLAAKESQSLSPGDYGPLTPSDFLSVSYCTDSDEDLALFGCGSCGEIGCWPMIMRVSRQDGIIIWSHFQQPYRDSSSHNFWDYSGFGPFRFEEKSYDTQLSQIQAFNKLSQEHK